MLTSCIALWDIFLLFAKALPIRRPPLPILSLSLSLAARIAMETQQLEIF